MAAGFVTPFAYKGATYYLSQADIVILGGLFGLAILGMVGFHIYFLKTMRKAREAAGAPGVMERRRGR